ncbi:hypothetical protein GCM10018790_49720 [Kitasatospora xanthocidica]|nr:hypothetical protein GCM10018790_49720 [Kitasatospora xanthocidica]
MRIPDALLALHLSACRERCELAEFVRLHAPVRDSSDNVQEEAARRQRSLEELERALVQAVRGHARTDEQVPEVRRALRRRAGGVVAVPDSTGPTAPAVSEGPR